MTEKTVVRGARPIRFTAGRPANLGCWPSRAGIFKYLIGPDGKLLNWFASTTAPTTDRVIGAIMVLLAGAS